MIALEKVCKSFQDKTVLNNVTLSLFEGERVGLLGASGAGKTTILDLIAQLCEPDSGRCTIAARERIAYVFQEPRLLPWRTALENVLFALAALPRNDDGRKKIEQTAHEALRAVGLHDVAHCFPGQLSGGMCQRVSIARALAIRPDILLLDEPFSALDRKRKQHLLSDLNDMLQSHPRMTVLYVTHHPDELHGIVDETYLIENGHLTRQGVNRSAHLRNRQRA